MKLNKDNSYASLSSYYNEARLTAETWKDSFPKARVIEIPKVWREDGKQYKVISANIGGGHETVLYGTSFIVKAPSGCSVNCPYAERIEYYD
jgi:hypothetical protein